MLADLYPGGPHGFPGPGQTNKDIGIGGQAPRPLTLADLVFGGRRLTLGDLAYKGPRELDLTKLPKFRPMPPLIQPGPRKPVTTGVTRHPLARAMIESGLVI
jgi:hypothetical protein